MSGEVYVRSTRKSHLEGTEAGKNNSSSRKGHDQKILLYCGIKARKATKKRFSGQGRPAPRRGEFRSSMGARTANQRTGQRVALRNRCDEKPG